MNLAEKRRYAQPGFTFMELVVVVLVLGILAAVGIPTYMNLRARAERNSTIVTLKNLKGQLDIFKADMGKYPAKLSELAERPKGELAKKWQGPYFETVPQDGWKNDFYYKVTPGGKHPYELYSYGPNGEEGSPDERFSIWD
ncbi:MAG: type II secretion system major pseudopilin GspG [Candidatus Babeliales bacterium]